MAAESFDFSFVDKAWTWTHRLGDDIVERSARSFSNLNDCITDARRAGFHASDEGRSRPPAVAMLSADAGAYVER